MSSTNDYAKELLSQHDRVLVTALHQTAGRGRQGRPWLGDHGANAYCTIGIRHTDRIGVEEAASYMARGALCMIGALRQVAPSPLFRLKYPNDVQALTREGWAKIGGTLVEHEYQGDRCTSTVVGLGVNIEQSKFADTIDQPCTSLYLLGSDVSLSSFMLALRTTMERVMRSSWQDMHTEWLRELNITGRTVQIKGEEGSWTVREVLPDGRLAVINDESHTERVLTNGDSVRYHDPIE